MAISEWMVVGHPHESAEIYSIPSWTFTSSSFSWSPCLGNLVSALWLGRMGDRCCPHLCDPLLGLLRLRRAFWAARAGIDASHMYLTVYFANQLLPRGGRGKGEGGGLHGSDLRAMTVVTLSFGASESGVSKRGFRETLTVASVGCVWH